MQACRYLLTSMFAFLDARGISVEIFHLEKNETHPFQISVYHAEVVHVLQPVRNAGQLNGRASVTMLRDHTTTYQLGAVYVLIHLNKLVDVSVFHPLGNQSESVFIQRHPNQR